MNIWQVLEIEPTADLAVIKTAYAKKIKQCKPEVDPEGFQLIRNAYELAQKYAAGENIDLNQTAQTTTYNSVENLDGTTNKKNPADLVFYLLEVLHKDEKAAVELLKRFQQEGQLDNLEFSEGFQQVLAINLLTASMPHYCAFIIYVIEFFNWYEHPETKSNSFFGIALTNLLNQTAPYRFSKYLHYISLIKHKQVAKEQKFDWNACFAAKTLINRSNIFKFYCVTLFCRKKTKAILDLLTEIETRYPQLMGIGVSISSFAWWYKYKYRKFTKAIFLPLLIFIVLFLFLLMGNKLQQQLAVIKTTNVYKKINTDDKGPSLYKIKLDGPVRVNSDINLGFASVNQMPKQWDNDNALKKTNLKTQLFENKGQTTLALMQINTVLESIHIDQLIAEKLNKQLNKINHSKRISNLKGDISLSLIVNNYGLKELADGKRELFLELLASATQNGGIIWDDRRFFYMIDCSNDFLINQDKSYILKQVNDLVANIVSQVVKAIEE